MYANLKAREKIQSWIEQERNPSQTQSLTRQPTSKIRAWACLSVPGLIVLHTGHGVLSAYTLPLVRH
jgi:hypothetical protein